MPCACDSTVRLKIKNSSAIFHFENKDAVASFEIELNYENKANKKAMLLLS